MTNEERADKLGELIIKYTLPQLAQDIAVNILMDIPYSTENYFTMDYLADKGYNIPRLLKLNKEDTYGYNRHRTLLSNGGGYKNKSRD